MDASRFSQMLEALREEAEKHLRVEARPGSDVRERERIDGGDEFVVHVTVSNEFAGDGGQHRTARFRNVRLHVRGTESTELLTWCETADPPLLLARELASGESVSTTVRLRATSALIPSLPSSERLADVRIEADVDLGRPLGGVERRASLSVAAEPGRGSTSPT